MEWLRKMFWLRCIECNQKKKDVEKRWDPFLDRMGFPLENELCVDCYKQSEEDGKRYFGY